MKKSHISLLFLGIIAAIVSVVFLLNPRILTQIGSTRVTSAEPPIILVHGFNQSSDFWNDIHLISELEEKGTINMGNFHSTENDDVELLAPKDITQGQS